MRAIVGDDDSEWKPMAGCFGPGTPLYNEEGGEMLKGPRWLDLSKRLLAEAGYAGEPITLIAAQDIPHNKAWGDVTVDLLQHPWRQGGLCRSRHRHPHRGDTAKIATQSGRMA